MRARSFLLLAVATAVASAACARFSQFGPTSGPPEGVVSLAVSSAASVIAPADYDVPVAVALHNGTGAPLRRVRVSLAFDGTAAAMSTRFRALESDVRSDVVGAGASVLFAFQVEALPSARFSDVPVDVGAVAIWTSAATPAVSTSDASWSPAAPMEFVVTSTSETTSIGGLSLGGAILDANGFAGLRRITFDPTVFPPGSPRTIVLNSGLPAITGGAGDLLIVDGVGAGVVLTPAASEEGSEQYMFDTEGPAAIADLTLLSSSLEFPYFDLSVDGCNGGSSHGGGSLLAHAATVIEHLRLDDSAVATRNCYSSNMVFHGGSGHRILRSLFLDAASDVLFTDVPMTEFSDNRVVGARNDVLGLSGFTGVGFRVVRNLFVGNSGNALRLAGATTDEVEIWNDTFANESVLSPIEREDARPVNVRNDVFSNVTNDAIRDNSGQDGTGFDIAHVDCDPTTTLAAAASIANAVLGTDLRTAPLGLTNPSGTEWASFEPQTGSPVVDSGVDLIDLNGVLPGRFAGAGPDAGAVESGAVPPGP